MDNGRGVMSPLFQLSSARPTVYIVYDFLNILKPELRPKKHHYLNKWWPSSHICVTTFQWVTHRFPINMLYHTGIWLIKGCIDQTPFDFWTITPEIDRLSWRLSSHRWISSKRWQADFCGPIYWHGLTLISTCISNHMLSKVWDEITYSFSNFNGATVEVWEWISNLISDITVHVVT